MLPLEIGHVKVEQQGGISKIPQTSGIAGKSVAGAGQKINKVVLPQKDGSLLQEGGCQATPGNGAACHPDCGGHVVALHVGVIERLGVRDY